MNYHSLNRNLKLRKKNRVRSIQSSLQIEANSMTVEQVTDIMNGKKVLGPPRDIKEVKNAIEAYKLLPELDPYSIKDLLRTHGIMMADLTDQSGMFRTVGVNVVNSSTGEVIHYAPHPDYVPRFIEELMQWASTSEDHPLIVSCVFHHEFEYIHPFTDGNGRTGRLWQNLILSKWNPVFEWIPVESAIRDRQSEYYRCIREATDLNDTSVFIDFMLESIKESLQKTMKDSADSLRSKILSMIKGGKYTTAAEAAKKLGVSEKTIEREIAMLRDEGVIVREGSNKTGSWKVVRRR
ncbi:MAG: Fic family protein [Candidatus Methanomethylophilaceae archaeon]|nr:Fic family protein [Candidatus Methanomethylophilaceae archaeon]